MSGKDLEKVLLWEAPHIGEKAPEQIPELLDDELPQQAITSAFRKYRK